MLYFRVLLQGMAQLPPADEQIRAQLTERADREGLETLHAELAAVDPEAAARIHSNDSQRIQRALEVFMLTGEPISALQQNEMSPLAGFDVKQIALMPSAREKLHARIAERFQNMLKHGFLEEVKKLMARGDLSPELPSMRSVGYRQAWDFLAGNIDEATMKETAIAATRQLAKRQMTWLRTWPNCDIIDSEADDVLQQVKGILNG
jgi:tRNA dimethylallyltransferase